MIKPEDRKKTKYCYKAFGLDIISDFCFDGLVETAEIEKNADTVEIVNSGIKEFDNIAAGIRGTFCKIYNHIFYSQIEDVCRYTVSNGNKIVISPINNQTADAFADYIFGTAICVLHMQRGNMTLHGNAVKIDDYGIIIMGRSGAGKSSLSSYMVKEGFKMIADDLAVIQKLNDNNASVHYGIPRQKLWSDMAERLYGGVNAYEKIPGCNGKYYIPVEKWDNQEPVKIKAIFEIVNGNGNIVSISELKGSDKICAIANNIYCSALLRIMEIGKLQFENSVFLANECRIFRLNRPDRVFTVDDQYGKIMSSIR